MARRPMCPGRRCEAHRGRRRRCRGATLPRCARPPPADARPMGGRVNSSKNRKSRQCIAMGQHRVDAPPRRCGRPWKSPPRESQQEPCIFPNQCEHIVGSPLVLVRVRSKSASKFGVRVPGARCPEKKQICLVAERKRTDLLRGGTKKDRFAS